MSKKLTCARLRPYNFEQVVKIENYELKKVDSTKFLGIINYDRLNWEHHIEHLVEKLSMSMVKIKRITKFIPKSELI